ENVDNASLTISETPTPNFELDNPSGCGPLTVNFTDSSQGSDLSYDWNFGNGESSTMPIPPSATYSAGVFDTTYLIQLTVSNNCGSALVADSLVVRAPPVADFGTQVNSGCSPLEISFANVTTGNADGYSWDLGNGQVWADSLPPNQIYTTLDSIATSYTINLIATNVCGSDTTQQDILVEPSTVTPFFNVDNTQGCQPLTVNFTNYASYGATVSWNFGDGTTSGELDPSHTFNAPGFYTVYQHALSACGEDSLSMNIEVLPAPEALFTHPPEICPDETIIFENLSDEFQTVFWDFGDGNNSTVISPEHEYAQAGNYEVTMVISNTAYGCQSIYQSDLNILERPVATLSVDNVSGCPPLDVCFNAEAENAPFFEWTFGDNNTSTALNPCHSYAESGLYTAQLRAANEQGCMSIADTISIRVFDQPLASFTLPEPFYCGENQSIIFTNTSEGATNYDWTFSNGLSSSLSEPEVNFNEIGDYSIDLTVSNTFNCQDQTTACFSILPQPMVDFAPILLDACAPQVVIFDNASLNANNYYWDFGNGETTSEPNPEITYNEAGTYDVSLIATYDDLCFDSLQLSGSVELLHRPTALFSWDIPNTEFDGLIRFNNESVNATSYFWDFGDGTFSEEASPVHDYQVNGNWEAELLAISTNGCTDTARVEITPDFMYKIFFPNALSPESGEGDVRLFKPVGIGFAAWKLEVFSPWGQRVFLADDLKGDQPIAAWDGSFNGEVLPQGAYAYKATVEYLNGVKRIYTGSVTLIR
ncbi:MAG: PKD domain-containing protein, partial [Bacteroidota bacterium]